MGAAAHQEAAASGGKRLADAHAAEDDCPGRKVRPRDQLEQALEVEPGIVDQCEAGVDHLAEIVRRDVGRHADRDAARTVHQEVRELGRQNGRLAVGLVVVRPEVDGVLVDVAEQRIRGLREARFGVAHRRGRIAIHRAEVALAVDQHEAHREVLGHAHQGVVDGVLAVRVVLAHHVADDARALARRPAVVVAALAHGVEDPPMDRLEAVAHVRQRPRHDHAHGVIEVGALHLLLDRHDLDGTGRIGSQAGLSGWKGAQGKPVRSSGGARLAERYRLHKFCAATGTRQIGGRPRNRNSSRALLDHALRLSRGSAVLQGNKRFSRPAPAPSSAARARPPAAGRSGDTRRPRRDRRPSSGWSHPSPPPPWRRRTRRHRAGCWSGART